MLLNKKTIDEYNSQGVVLLKKVINNDWIKILKQGIKKNFINPSKYKCVYEKKYGKELFYDDYCNWNRID